MRGLGSPRLLLLSRPLGPGYRNAAYSVVFPRAGDYCIAPADRQSTSLDDAPSGALPLHQAQR